MGSKQSSSKGKQSSPKAMSSPKATSSKAKPSSKSPFETGVRSRVLLLWCNRHFRKGLSSNVVREVCSYLLEAYNLVLVEQKEVWLFNVKEEKWTLMWQLNSAVAGYVASLAFVGSDSLFICGGLCASAYSIKAGKVTELQPMSCVRSGHGLLYYPPRACLLVFGGFDGGIF